MGQFCSFLYELVYSVPQIEEFEYDFTYSVFNPLQIVKPEDRSKDIVSYRNKNRPNDLSTFQNGCETLWKCFKRSVWRYLERPFLGARKLIKSHLAEYRFEKETKYHLGDYEWLTYAEVDEIVESFTRSLQKR